MTIFNLPLLGKPNPYEQYDESWIDGRARIAQSGMKDDTQCVYYTLNYLRERIGKHPDNQSLPQRKFELKRSQLRKDLVKINSCIPDKIRTFTKIVFERFYGRIQIDSQRNLHLTNCSQDELDKLSSQDQKYKNAFDAFKSQNAFTDFFMYLSHLKHEKQREYLEKFLESENIDVKTYYEQYHRVLMGCSWENLSEENKETCLHNYILNASAKAYGLEKSPWTPHAPINDLIEELKQSQLFIGGHFGQSWYDCPPTKIPDLKIEGREVYYWKDTDPKFQIGQSHAILLVGAAPLSNSVYYIDPVHESDPKNPQPLYMISYDQIKHEIIPLDWTHAPYWPEQSTFIKSNTSGFAYRKKALREISYQKIVPPRRNVSPPPQKTKYRSVLL